MNGYKKNDGTGLVFADAIYSSYKMVYDILQSRRDDTLRNRKASLKTVSDHFCLPTNIIEKIVNENENR